MPINDSQPGEKPYRLIEQMQVELPALEKQERALLELMGGPFPERMNDFRGFSRVLDIACGTGSWAMEVARAYPELEVVGLAFQHGLMTRASERARAAGLHNVRFLLAAEQDQPHLPFAEEEFDLVNAQYLYSWLHTGEWTNFMRDCWRVTRPGGYLRITEPERGQSTSLAFTRLEDLMLQALQTIGQRFSPDERHIGAATRLMYLYRAAGWQDITRHAYLTDYGKTGDLPEKPFVRIQLYIQTLKPILLRERFVGEEELNELLQTVSAEMERADFAANRYLISFCGRKTPGSEPA
jgi:ubiquinone/menaquinone biosynthesis C-methylase UbiE